MIDVNLHVYYNNNSLSSAWPITLAAIPNKGDRIEYQIPTQPDGDPLWSVVGVTHFPASEDMRARVMVKCRPLWAVEDAD